MGDCLGDPGAAYICLKICATFRQEDMCWKVVGSNPGDGKSFLLMTFMLKLTCMINLLYLNILN